MVTHKNFLKVLFKSIKTPLIVYFAIAGNIITFSSAYIFYILEHPINPMVRNYFDALWWGMCTVSTVGYGDIYPITTGGRLIGIFLIIVGITFFLSTITVLVTVMHEVVKKTSK